jgi:uncharacterized membrane protein
MGIGFGGFVDGIVLHQILQWHHMLTDEGYCPAGTVIGIEDNSLAEGFFHVAAWLAVMAGTIAATRAWQRGELAPPWGSHFGGLLLGWNLFNLVEGLIDHQILGIHHVRDDLRRAARLGSSLPRARRPAGDPRLGGAQRRKAGAPGITKEAHTG